MYEITVSRKNQSITIKRQESSIKVQRLERNITLDHTGKRGLTGPEGPQGDQGPGSNIRVYTWVIDTPVVGGIPGPRLKEPHTITSIESYVTALTSIAFNVEERTVIGTPGTDILASDQVADMDGASDTTFAHDEIATDSWLWLDLSNVTGSPQKLVVTVSAIV